METPVVTERHMRRTWGLAHYYARRMGKEHLTDEFFSEGIVGIAVGLRSWKPIISLDAWIGICAKRYMVNFMYYHTAKRRDGGETSEYQDQYTHAESIAIDPIAKRRLVRGIKKLSPKQRAALEMWLNEYPKEQIADIQGVSRQAIQSSIERSLAKLKKELVGA